MNAHVLPCKHLAWYQAAAALRPDPLARAHVWFNTNTNGHSCDCDGTKRLTSDPLRRVTHALPGPQVVVEAIERRYDEGRSLLTAHQLCVFTALLMDMRSPFCAKWLRHTLGYMGSCRWATRAVVGGQHGHVASCRWAKVGSGGSCRWAKVGSGQVQVGGDGTQGRLRTARRGQDLSVARYSFAYSTAHCHQLLPGRLAT